MKNLFLCCVFLISKALLAQVSAQTDVLNYIEKYKQLAIEEMKRSGVPASIKLAQGILETEAGKSDLVRRSNNHFGIKCKTNWTGEKVYHDDDARGECFRAYSSSEESYRDHSDFLRNNQRYASLFTLRPTDYEGWANGLKKAGYATNPRYPQLLVKTIEEYNLQLYTEIALGLKTDPGSALVQHTPQTEVKVSPEPVVKKEVVQAVAKPAPVWPQGVFAINETKVVYAAAGTSLLAIAKEYSVGLPRLLDFNDMTEKDILEEAQLLYLQRKRKSGAAEFHIVQQGENLYSISQVQGIRLESLLALNHLEKWMQPASGEKLALKRKNLEKVALAGENSRKQAVSEPVAVLRPRAPEIEHAVRASEVFKNQVQHTVQPKETLYSISKKYDVSVTDIREWNRLTGNDLRIGQQLIIQIRNYAQDSGTR